MMRGCEKADLGVGIGGEGSLRGGAPGFVKVWLGYLNSLPGHKEGRGEDICRRG